MSSKKPHVAPHYALKPEPVAAAPAPPPPLEVNDQTRPTDPAPLPPESDSDREERGAFTSPDVEASVASMQDTPTRDESPEDTHSRTEGLLEQFESYVKFVETEEPPEDRRVGAAALREVSVEITHDLRLAAPEYRPRIDALLARIAARAETFSPSEPSPSEPSAPSTQTYRVLRTKVIALPGGMMTSLAKGSIVSEMSHDLASLRAQGVELDFGPPAE